MKSIIKISITVGLISMIMGIISRLSMKPFFVEAEAFLQFSQFCLLVAITFLLYKIAYKLNNDDD